MYLNVYLPWVGPTLLIIALLIIVLLTSSLAAHAVMKSLFWIGADLTLIIFLSQSYCEVPDVMRKADDSLKTLLGIGLIFVVVKFIQSLYKEIPDHMNSFQEVNGNRKSRIFYIFFAIFTGIFIWQAYQVVSPIILNLCIYKNI